MLTFAPIDPQIYVGSTKIITAQIFGTVQPAQATIRYVAVPTGSQLIEAYVTATTTLRAYGSQVSILTNS